ncbi:SIS domain-containing protein [Thermostilla marina]
MLGVQLDLPDYLKRIGDELAKINLGAVERLSEKLFEAYEQGRFIFICGNGGSATNASHIAEDLGKSAFKEADLQADCIKRLKIMSLTDNVGWITALGNDMGYDQIFVQQLASYAGEGDVLIAISCSGNSRNVLTAVDWANRHGMFTYGMTGYDGGKLKQLAHDGLHVAVADTGMVEALHGCVFHWVVDDLYARVYKTGRYEADQACVS